MSLLALALTTGLAVVPQVEATVAPLEVTVGDRVVVRLEVHRRPPGTELAPLELEQWGDAEVVAVTPLVGTAGDDLAGWTVVLAAFRPGTVVLPPISLPLAPQGDALTTPPELSFNVRSVLPPEGEVEPRPASPPLALPAGPAFWWTAAGLAALCALTALALWRRRRPTPRAEPSLPPLARLERELDRLGREETPEAAHVGLSLALRRYLEASLGLPAPDRTTTEIQRALREGPLAADTKRSFVDLLRRCDAVKFARLAVNAEETARRLAAGKAAARQVEAELAAQRRPEEEAA